MSLDALTPRQIEVLGLLAEGLGGREIAHELGISYITERGHIADIYARLSTDETVVTNVVEALRAVGWIAAAPPQFEWHVTDGWVVL